MMELNHAVGAALRELRIKNGVSQEKVGASQSYVSDVERGFKSLSIDKLDEFAMNIGVHPLSVLAKAYLLTYEEINLTEIIARIEYDLEQTKGQ